MNHVGIPIGVATSVARASQYDAIDTLDYAHRNQFPLVQAYLDRQAVDDAGRRRAILERADSYGIELLWHAPGLMDPKTSTAPELLAAISHLTAGSRRKWVVYHFDEQQPVEESILLMEQLVRLGIVPCVENYHRINDPAMARVNYTNYVTLFRRARLSRLDVRAVLDVPRIFHSQVGLATEEAMTIAVGVSRDLGMSGIPVVLHLIDSTNQDMSAREDWCPIGRGVIPYAAMFPEIRSSAQLVGAILEFEDKSNPLTSVPFLRQFLEDSCRT